MTLAHTLAQQLLAALLLFQTGALYSLGVFNGAIEAAAPALRGVWAGSMGLMSLFGLPSMLLSGLYVTEGRAAPAPWHACRTPRIRIIVALGAASFATTAAAAVAVAAGRGRLLSAIVAGLGLAYGNLPVIVYLAGIELLAAWSPHRPGLAVGLGQMGFGLGSIIYTILFNALLDAFPVTTALYISAVFLTLPVALSVPFLKWPESSQKSHSHRGNDANVIGEGQVIPWLSLLSVPLFWYYIGTVCALQAPFALIPFFFKVGLSFGANMKVLVACFDVVFLGSTLLRPVAGVLADSLKITFFMILLAVTYIESFAGYVIASGILITVFGGGACGASILARDMFGAQNSSLVFGMGAAIGMGIDTASRYSPFHVVCVIWSLLGLICCVHIQRHPAYFSLNGNCSLDIDEGGEQSPCLVTKTNFGSVSEP